MSAAKQEPEARPKAPEKHFPQSAETSVQGAAQHGGVVTQP